jgi:hypothetical protein
MTEDIEALAFMVKVGIEIPAYANPKRKERAELWSDPVYVSEEVHNKILKILKEEVKKNERT